MADGEGVLFLGWSTSAEAVDCFCKTVVSFLAHLRGQWQFGLWQALGGGRPGAMSEVTKCVKFQRVVFLTTSVAG